MDNMGNRTVAVIFVVILMAGSVALFFMMEMMHQMNPDAHEESHSYVVYGTLYDAECSGEGVTKYAPESSKEYVYSLKLSFSSSDRTESIDTALIFDLDDRMIPELFHYEREDEIDGVKVSVYSRSQGNDNFTYYVGEKCKAIRIEASSDHYGITADISESA